MPAANQTPPNCRIDSQHRGVVVAWGSDGGREPLRTSVEGGRPLLGVLFGLKRIRSYLRAEFRMLARCTSLRANPAGFISDREHFSRLAPPDTCRECRTHIGNKKSVAHAS